MNYRERIRKAIECPRFGNERYGEWGALKFEQRVLIKRLLDELDNADNYFIRFYKENEGLKKQLEYCYCNRTDCSSRIKDSKVYDSLVQKTKMQQKEFILYLRHLSNWYSADGVKQGMVNEILQKYREIIGDDK